MLLVVMPYLVFVELMLVNQYYDTSFAGLGKQKYRFEKTVEYFCPVVVVTVKKALFEMQ